MFEALSGLYCPTEDPGGFLAQCIHDLLSGLFEDVICVGLLLQIGFFGYVLYLAADKLTNSATRLLLIPEWAHLVGRVVLPAVGVVPDVMLVIWPGLCPHDVAQKNVAVGFGVWAGSNFMLLTLLWPFCICRGRVTLARDGKPTYEKPPDAGEDWKKLDEPARARPEGCLEFCIQMPHMLFEFCVQMPQMLFESGVEMRSFQLRGSAAWMLASSFPYFIVLFPIFFIGVESDSERLFVVIGISTCFLCLFFHYLCWSPRAEEQEPDVMQLVAAITSGDMTLEDVMKHDLSRELLLREERENQMLAQDPLIPKEETLNMRRFRTLLGACFKLYDKNDDGRISFEEFCDLWKTLGVGDAATDEARRDAFHRFDKDQSGFLDHNEDQSEFVGCLEYYMREQLEADRVRQQDEQQKQLRLAKLYLVFALVLMLICPPFMCNALVKLADHWGVSHFNIAFWMAPWISNLSEFVSSTKIAAHKTKDTMATSLTTLTMAAFMNNTVCLGFLLVLIYFKRLDCQFPAEYISVFPVFLVQVIVGVVVWCKDVLSLAQGCCFLAIYPLALLLVQYSLLLYPFALLLAYVVVTTFIRRTNGQ